MQTLARAFAVFFLVVWALGCTQQVDITGDDMADKGAQSGNQQSTSGGWSKTAELTVGDASAVGAKSLQANFPVAGDYTVQFGSPSVSGVRVQADITWSVEGNDVQRTVSVGDGVSVTGTAQGVKVVIYDVTPSGGSNPTPGTDYTVGMQVAPGVRANTQKPPTLVPIPSKSVLTPGATATIPVPTNAGVVSIYFGLIAEAGGVTKPVASGDLFVSMLVGGTNIQSYDPVIEDGWIPVPPGTTSVTVTNGNTTNTIAVSCTFGIDG